MTVHTAFLTCSEAGRLADPPLTPAAIRAAVERGKLRVAALTLGGVRLFDPRDVEKYLLGRAQRRGQSA
jgi:hypothetical protein